MTTTPPTDPPPETAVEHPYRHASGETPKDQDPYAPPPRPARTQRRGDDGTGDDLLADRQPENDAEEGLDDTAAY